MRSIGSSVSQTGYDVKTCADRFRIYHSSFQTLKIFKKEKVTGTLPLTVYHNLGYYCPFEVIAHNPPEFSSQNWKRIPFSDGQFFNSVNARCYTDRIEIFDGDFTEASNSYTVIIYLDDFETVTENTVDTGDILGQISDSYGIKVSQPGYDVKSCSDEQTVFTSGQGFSEIVHKKGINTQRIGQVSVSHNQGFPLKFLAFQKKYNESFITPMVRRGRSTLTLDGAYIDSSNLYMGVDLGGGSFSTDYYFYYVMFKNKMN